MLIAIDPGIYGAIVTFPPITIYKLPENPTDIYDLLKELITADTELYIEKTGTYFPGNSGPAAVKFARHCGVLDVIPYSLGVDAHYITPSVWMKYYHPPKDKKERKNYLWNLAVEYYPDLKIPKYAADAIMLLDYARRHLNENRNEHS
jgi:hypothetical protein